MQRAGVHLSLHHPRRRGSVTHDTIEVAHRGSVPAVSASGRRLRETTDISFVYTWLGLVLITDILITGLIGIGLYR